MIQEKISNKILTIGPDYRYPSGGIAKLLNTYSQFFNRSILFQQYVSR